jgi:hypothetical protein
MNFADVCGDECLIEGKDEVGFFQLKMINYKQRQKQVF